MTWLCVGCTTGVVLHAAFPAPPIPCPHPHVTHTYHETKIMAGTPIVWTDCDGVRGFTVPEGWAVE